MQRLILSVIIGAAWLMVSTLDARAQTRRGYSYSQPRQSGGITWRNHSPSSAMNQQYLRPNAPVQRTQPLKVMTPVGPVTPVGPLKPLTSITPLRPLSSSSQYRPQQSGGTPSRSGSANGARSSAPRSYGAGTRR